MTLLRKDTWECITASNPQKLKDYSAVSLVGVDGSPLTIHCSATVYLHLDRESLATDVVVVSPLTAGAILGLDFLQEYQARIDFPNKQIHLAGRETTLPL